MENKNNIFHIAGTIKKTLGIAGAVWIFLVFPVLLVFADRLLLFNTTGNWKNAGIDVKIFDVASLFFASILPKIFTYPQFLIFWPLFLSSLWLFFTKKHRWIIDGVIMAVFLAFFTWSLCFICAKYCDSMQEGGDISGKNILQITLRDEQNQPIRFLEIYVA
jgi:hypothetical protein